MSARVIEVRHAWPLPVDPALAIENAWDPYHVQWVHPETVRSCRTVWQEGTAALVLYELKPLGWLPGYVRRFLVLKRLVDGGREVRFFAMPVSGRMSSLLSVRVTGGPAARTLEHRFRLRLPRWLRLAAPLLIRLRNRGERLRFAQDLVLMRERAAALARGHRDSEACLDKTTVLEDWFGDRDG